MFESVLSSEILNIPNISPFRPFSLKMKDFKRFEFLSKSWINGASLGQSDGGELFRIELSENDQFQTHISVTFQNKDYTETDCRLDRPSVINRMRQQNFYSDGMSEIMGATKNVHLFLGFENYAKSYFRKGLDYLRNEHTLCYIPKSWWSKFIGISQK